MLTEKKTLFYNLENFKIDKFSTFSKLFVVKASNAVYDVTMPQGLQSVNIFSFYFAKLFHA